VRPHIPEHISALVNGHSLHGLGNPTTRCPQIAVQPIQVDQQRTVVLGQQADRVGETGTDEESVVHLVN
jgi:hypothetical protein